MLSLVLITQNAGNTIEQTLVSAQHLVDEIVVVDSGSTDNTLAIAKQYNARIFHQVWLGFGLQKKYAVDQAVYDWVLCLDADEYLDVKIIENIRKELSNPRFIAYKLTRCNIMLGRPLYHGLGYPDRTVRLFNRQYVNWNDSLVHESVDLGTYGAGLIDGDYFHLSCVSISDYIAKQNRYTDIQAAKNTKKISMIKIILSPLWLFIRGYIFKRGFLDGLAGLAHISIAAFTNFLKQIKSYEVLRINKKE